MLPPRVPLLVLLLLQVAVAVLLLVPAAAAEGEGEGEGGVLVTHCCMGWVAICLCMHEALIDLSSLIQFV